MIKPKVITNHPVALDSYDHLVPYGTKEDNTKNMDYVEELIDIFGPDMSYLDLGCSGGGFVKQFHEKGVFAVGIEGSDYSLIHKRAEWATIPDYLFTADITKAFRVVDQNDKQLQFDVISMFDVLEHIKSEDLSMVFHNIKNHLKPDGMFVAGIATIDCGPHHPTVKPEGWWIATMEHFGFVQTVDLINFGRITPIGVNGCFKLAESKVIRRKI